MIRVLVLVFALAAPTLQQNAQGGSPKSPCPTVFMYEPPGPDTEPGKWYGVISLTTDIALRSLVLNIVIDAKADLLGNWIGEVSTQNNMDFNIENADFKVSPGVATPVRIFVKFNPLDKTPRLKVIKLNGREICNNDRPLPNIDNYADLRDFNIETTTKARRWDDIWPEDEPMTRDSQARLTDSEVIFIDYSKKPFISSPRASNNEVVWKIPKVNNNTQRTTPRPPQVTYVPRKLEPEKPAEDDYEASYEDTRKDYFDGVLLVRPVN